MTSRAHKTIHALSPPGSTPTQARASAAGGYEHWPWSWGSRRGAMEAMGPEILLTPRQAVARA